MKVATRILLMMLFIAVTQISQGQMVFSQIPTCVVIGNPYTLSVTPAPGMTSYEWTCNQNILMNGSIPSVTTSIPTIDIQFNDTVSIYKVCVTAFNASTSVGPICASNITSASNISTPVFDPTNNVLVTPGVSYIYTVLPVSCASQYHWTFSGAGTFNNGTNAISGSSNSVDLNLSSLFGSGDLCVYATSPTGASSDTICMQLVAALGLNTVSEQLLNIFYDESGENIFIELPGKETGMASINIYDITGRKIYFTNAEITSNESSIRISSSFLSKGLFIVKFNFRNKIYTGKFIRY